MNSSEVWKNLHKLFDTDNGDYSDIELLELTGNQVEEIFLFLKTVSILLFFIIVGITHCLSLL